MTLKQYLAIVTLLSFLIVSPVLAASDQCLKCHQSLIDTATTKLVIHPPFSQNHCDLCHSPQTDKVSSQSLDPAPWGRSLTEKPRIEWLAESFIKNRQQVALLPVEVCDGQLTIKLWYQDGSKQQSEIRCPDLASIPLIVGSSAKPTISQLRLLNYNDQLFPRATLEWRTDVPCRCQLLYRFDDHQYVEGEDDFYTFNHTQEIRDFNPTNIEVSVQCDDIDQQRSQQQFVSLVSLPKGEPSPELPQQNAEEFLTVFKRNADFIEISIATNQPAAISLGRIEQNQMPFPAEIKLPDQIEPAVRTTDHPLLADEEQVNTTICFQCHKNTVAVASHPINVLPPPGMVIPPEYPLLSNGRLTCMTCHSRHSSDYEARLIKEGKKELCTGCHTNY